VRGKIGVLGAIGATALLALGVAACGSGGSGSSDTPAASPSPSPTAAISMIVTDTELPKVVHARVGDTVKVMLHSNSSTGYQWVAQDLNAAAVLKQDGDAKIIPPKKALVGAPGHTQFTFAVVKEGTDEIGFWYQPPGSGPAGATWALVVKASAGHVPVNVDAGEDYTAETAQLRTGDNLLVSIDGAANAGRRSWQMIGGSPLVKLVSQKFTDGTQQMTFAGMSAGTGTLVLVNRPTGDPPLQTYALPLAVKAPKAPVTIQLNRKSDSQNVLVKGGDTIQVSLQDQPSTDFQWKFQKPNAKVLKQVGKPKFFADSSRMGSKGKMVWTFSVVGAGRTPLIADYQQVPTQATPMDTWQVNVAAKPGFTPKTVAGDSTSAADSAHVLPGDQINLKLASSAGTWSKPASTKQLSASAPVKQGQDVMLSFTAKNRGIVTPVMTAVGPSGYPAQAYAFSATVGKGKLPITVDAAERHAAKPIDVSVGQTIDIAMEGNTASTGYQWTVSSVLPDGVIQETGQPSVQSPTDAMPGAAGATVLHFKALAAGTAELVLQYMPPDGSGVPGAVYMTMVNVK
jgi:predicted secreted protein